MSSLYDIPIPAMFCLLRSRGKEIKDSTSAPGEGHQMSVQPLIWSVHGRLEGAMESAHCLNSSDPIAMAKC